MVHNGHMADRLAVLSAQAERVSDEITALEKQLDGGSLVVPGSRGQDTANPLLRELRAHRWLLIRLVDSAYGPVLPAAGPDVIDELRAEWEHS